MPDCPVCRASHHVLCGQRQFIEAKCPVCLQQQSPFATLPCGHGVCDACLENIGGALLPFSGNRARSRSPLSAWLTPNLRSFSSSETEAQPSPASLTAELEALSAEIEAELRFAASTSDDPYTDIEEHLFADDQSADDLNPALDEELFALDASASDIDRDLFGDGPDELHVEEDLFEEADVEEFGCGLDTTSACSGMEELLSQPYIESDDLFADDSQTDMSAAFADFDERPVESLFDELDGVEVDPFGDSDDERLIAEELFGADDEASLEDRFEDDQLDVCAEDLFGDSDSEVAAEELPDVDTIAEDLLGDVEDELAGGLFGETYDEFDDDIFAR